MHFCIGAPLSRLESVIALEKIAQRWNTMEVTDAKGHLEEWPLRFLWPQGFSGLLESHYAT